jgi:hypothetical protein
LTINQSIVTRMNEVDEKIAGKLSHRDDALSSIFIKKKQQKSCEICWTTKRGWSRIVVKEISDFLGFIKNEWHLNKHIDC